MTAADDPDAGLGFALGAQFAKAREAAQFLTDCPECGARVLEMPLQEKMRLDFPAVDRADQPAAIWSLSKIGSTWLAGAGGVAFGDRGHTLHAHQPAIERPRDFIHERLEEIDAHIAARR